MKTLRQKLTELRYSFVHTPQAIRFVWRNNHWGILALGLLTLGGALLPAAQAWVGKLIVDGVVAAIQHGPITEQHADGFCLSNFRIDADSAQHRRQSRRAG